MDNLLGHSSIQLQNKLECLSLAIISSFVKLEKLAEENTIACFSRESVTMIEEGFETSILGRSLEQDGRNGNRKCSTEVQKQVAHFRFPRPQQPGVGLTIIFFFVTDDEA
jgi:hypothetical protein